MKTNFAHRPSRRTAIPAAGLLLVSLVLFPASVFGQKKRNPTSKVFISDLSGEAQIDTGDNIQDLNKRSVYTAQGTIIETKKADKPEDAGKIFSTMVYSNGTGAYFDQDTKVEVKKFVQEPFTPNRSDMDVEPSISQTQAYVAKGVVGLCTSKLVAGSTMNYSTPQGAVNIRGKKVVIEANDNETKISMLEGDSTVRGGEADMGGHILREGQQAIIRRGRAGQPNIVTVQPIPPAEATVLDDKVAMACIAKKTVYFEVKERPIDPGPAGSSEQVAADTATNKDTKDSKDTKDTSTKSDSTSVASSDATASGSSGASGSSSTASGGSVFSQPTTSGTVTAFDGPVANAGPSTVSPVIANRPTTIQEIVAVPVVPVNLPVEFTVSPARIVTQKPGG